MLKNQKQRSDSIEQSLQNIHSLITRATCPPLPTDEGLINQAKAQYNKLLQHRDYNLYNFLPFDQFVEEAEQMPRVDIFYAYITKIPEEFVQIKFSSGKTVVASNAYENKEGKAGNHFEESVFEQMDVIDVLKRDYRVEAAQSHMIEVIQIDDTVKKLEANIVALSMGKGSAFGTGILIDSQLVLTARHCIEERNIEDIVIRTNFQLQEDGTIDIWNHHKIAGIVELGTNLDYAIILLSEPIENFQRMDLFDLEDQADGISLLIHHPKGWVKKVSAHNSLESIYTKVSYAGFQDSSKGSSGGAYINARQKIFALHGLNMQGQTSAIFMKDIFRETRILQNLDIRVLEVSTERVKKSEYSKIYHEFLETLEGKPTSLEEYIKHHDKRLPGAVSLSYHHIIPKANLEFLWMLGKLNPSLEEKLKLLSWNIKLSNPTLVDDHIDSDGNLFVQNMVWAPWNLFLGPEARSDDSKSIDGAEQNRPFSFNQELWNKIKELNDLLEQSWVSSVYLQEQVERGWITKTKDKISKEKVLPIKKAVIKKLDAENKDASILHEKPAEIKHDLTQGVLDSLSGKLQELVGMSSVNDSPNYLHRTLDNDWVHGDQSRYSIVITRAALTGTDAQSNTLYIYIENSRLVYAYKDKKLRFVEKFSEGGDGDLLQKVSSYTDENIPQLTLAEESTILKKKELQLLGNYRLKVAGQDDPDSKIDGLMYFSEEYSTVYAIYQIVSDNLLLLVPGLLTTTKRIGGMTAVNDLITLGADTDIAQQIIEAINESELEEVINLLLTKPQSTLRSQPLLLENSNTPSAKLKPTVSSAAITGLMVLDLFESASIVQYFFKEIFKLDIQLPKISNEAWIATHFAIGATVSTLLPISDYTIQDKLIICGTNSLIYGTRIQLSDSVNKIGLLPVIAMQTLLVFNNPYHLHEFNQKTMFYNMAISASISGMQYYQYYYDDQTREKPMTEIIIPYVVDIVVATFALQHIHLPNNNHAVSYLFFTKQILTTASILVTADYTSKTLLSFISNSIKNLENQIFNYFDNSKDNTDYSESERPVLGDTNTSIAEEFLDL